MRLWRLAPGLLLLAGCRDDGSSVAGDVPFETITIPVSVDAAGTCTSAQGLEGPSGIGCQTMVHFEGGLIARDRTVEIGGSPVNFTNLDPGTYTVTVDVPDGCQVEGSNPVVTSGDPVPFSLECDGLILELSGNSRGSGRITSDPPGFDCTLTGVTITGTEKSGTCVWTFPRFTNVSLDFTADAGSEYGGAFVGSAFIDDSGCDEPPDCTIQVGDHFSTVPQFTIVRFDPVGAPPTGDILVSVSTAGESPDPDGYLLSVDGEARQVANEAEEYFLGLEPGDHEVFLSEIAPNCAVSGENPRTVSVTVYGVGITAFDVACSDIPAISGRVVNATDGAPIVGALVGLRAGLDADPGDAPVASTFTDGSGGYALAADPGDYTISAKANGFISQSRNTTLVDEDVEVRFTLAPPPDAGQTLIVLSWDATPTDLDGHLWGPDRSGGRFHIYYDEQQYPDPPASPDVAINVDDDDGFGPETTSINLLRAGRYCYAVHNFEHDPSLFDGAIVRVILDNETVTDFTPPAGVISTVWTVFVLDADAGGNITITPVNTVASGPEPTDPPAGCGL